ncbi:hypothetical protein [Neobacillus dielmonensis]|uniref:hypothetical protein n=1 Tax=Neobacillus dielmonensis TaxID=1347369 RepID=UPI0005A77A78|nr:hypothetical protein [Neobacillus dielmonensis]
MGINIVLVFFISHRHFTIVAIYELIVLFHTSFFAAATFKIGRLPAEPSPWLQGEVLAHFSFFVRVHYIPGILWFRKVKVVVPVHCHPSNFGML